MWIELTHGTTGKPIYFNTQQIAAITQHWDKPELTVIAIIGDSVPWQVKETVDEVMLKIKNPKLEKGCLFDCPLKEPIHAHWIEYEDDSLIHGKCSNCQWEAHLYEDDVVGMQYCPNCGALMIKTIVK